MSTEDGVTRGVVRSRPSLGRLPASAAQRRLWFLDQLHGPSASYNVPYLVRLRGELNLDALRRAVGTVVGRHESLRTRLRVRDDELVQVVERFEPESELVEYVEAGGEEQALRLLDEEGRRPFRLTEGRLLRVRLARIGPADHVLLVALHHAITDGWSESIVFDELGRCYDAEVAGLPVPLAPPAWQYADYTVWEREWLGGAECARQLAYWERRLRDCPPVLTLPVARQRPARPSPGTAGDTVHFELEPALVERLAALGREQQVSVFVLMVTALTVLLYRYTRQPHLVVGVPMANRNREEWEGVVGLFVNTVALRADLSGRPSFAELLGRVRAATFEAYAHQDVPFEQVSRRVGGDRDPGANPIFQVMCNLVDAPRELRMRGLSVQIGEVPTRTAKFDLELNVALRPTGLDCGFEYATDLFDAATITRMVEHYQAVLAAMVADPLAPITGFDVLSADERRLLRELNATGSAYPDGTLHGLVEQQARRTPEAVAVVHGEEATTYRELDEWAERVASGLRRLGVGPESPVAVRLARSVDLVAALLGVLKAGGAFVPLDPDYPPRRLELMVQRSGATVTLDETLLAELVRGSATARAPAAVARDSAAYTIFTSGSTGEPKGVVNTHRGICNTILGLQQDYRLGEGDAVLQSTPLGFDPSVWQIFWPLVAGARLVLPAAAGHRDTGHLVDLIERAGVTVMHAVPAMLEVLLDEPGWPSGGSLRRVLCGGEAPSAALWRRFASRSQAELSNVYGPAEAAVEATRWRGGARESFVPLGSPNQNVTVYLLDGDLMPVPTGVPGELCIGGDGLARGYVDRPQWTAERFVPDPFGERPGARLYRTGDLARRHPDGTLEYLGRLDRQVKLRGMRIETGEIESRLREVPGVRAAAVTLRHDRAGGSYLAAFVEPAGVSEAAVHTHLAANLPEHMLPAAVHRLDALPLNANGKLDYGALAVPGAVAAPAPRLPGQAPVTPTERQVAAVWAEVFGLPRVGRGDHFFRLGGHSLLATKVLARIRRRLRLDAPLRMLFEAPVLADFANRLDGLAVGDTSVIPIGVIPTGVRPAAVPLSFAQERLWFLDQFEPDKAVYNVAYAVWLDGELDLSALRRTLDRLVERHEVLRTTFQMLDDRHDDQPMQVVAPPSPVELRGVDVAEEHALRTARVDAVRPFDLRRGPMLRATAYRTAPERHLLVLGTHHIAFDDWSKNVLATELSIGYAAERGDPTAQLDEPPVQYADYAVWQRERLDGDVLTAQVEHWRERLRGAPALLDLPTDRPRPAMQTYRGGTESMVLPRGAMQALHRLALRKDATPFMALLASFTILLGRYTGSEDVVVGTTVANRGQQEVEDLIGFFVNTLVLRTDLAGDPTFERLLERVRETTLDAYAHQDVPFEKLVEQLAPQRSLSFPPLVQVLFDMQTLAREPVRLDGLVVRPVDIDQGVAKFDLVVSLAEARPGAGVPQDIEDEGGLDVEIQYNSDLFDASTVRRLLAHWRLVIERVLDRPASPISELSLLSQAERRLVLTEWNQTRRPVPQRSGLAELFEEQVGRTPDAAALVHGEHRLTYRQLNARANQLAHWLIGRGVGPDVRVGLSCDRSVDALVGLLGILKAGGAYVPIDPSYPPRRRELMAEQAGVALWIDSPALAALTDELSGLPADNPPPRTHPEHLAYVLYTSGSTGRPKGVAMPHRALLNLFAWQDAALPLAPGTPVLRFAPLGFDVSCQELFSTWMAGGTIVELPDDAARRDPQALLDLMERERVERWFVPYSGLVNVAHWGLREPRRRELQLRTIVTAGEQLQLTQDLMSWLRRIGTGCSLVNHYGPTETHAATAYHLPASPASPASQAQWSALPPIGRPIANAQVYLLDRNGQPVPVGVPGELYVGGDGLARGYLDRPQWTAERFVPDPFGARPGARLYRTGDLARYRPDGALEFRGRVDAQLKLRGYRVEPGEIEAVLEEHPEVRGAAVTVHGDGPHRRLVGYVAGAALDSERLREHLRARLPDYLVPAQLVVLDALPRNRNGKVDRAALPVPDLAHRHGEPGTPPRSPTERAIARIWQRVLEIDRVGVHDDFFALGGHSLLATRVIAQVRSAVRSGVPLKAIFEHPTVAGLASAIDRMPTHELDEPDEPPISRRPRQPRSLQP